jgi:PAS domain S-box-containing protein
MSKPLKILIVEDSEDDALLLIRELRRGGFDPISERVESPAAMRDALERRQWDLVISDYLMPRFSGLDALETVRLSGLDLPFIIVSGNIGEDIAVGAMKAGAHDYIIKGSLARLVPAVERELREAEERSERRETERRIVVTTALLELFTRKFNKKEYLDAACELIRGWCGCNHVGIRIVDREGNVPFSSCAGHGEAFLKEENLLSLELDHCICTRIMRGTPEPSDLVALTSGGAFYSNDTARFLEELTGESRARYRGVCMRYGYRSLAVIPIRKSDRVLGAIHIADEREGMLPRKAVESLEQMAFIIGEAMVRFGIEEERARLASAVQSTAEAIAVTDPRGMILYVNPAFERITGYGKEEILGLDLHFLDSGRHEDAFYARLRETLAREGVWNGQLMNKRRDGAIYYEDCTISPVRGPSGEIVNYVSVRRDVTDKLRLESIAESVNTMDNIGYVFSGVRHEIGNPINSINAILTVLRSKLDALSTESVRGYLDRTIEQIARVEYILRSLKSFNLYETQELQNVSVTDFFESFLPLVKGDFSKRGTGLETVLDDGAAWAYTDPRALQQVLLNIITNAADAVIGRAGPKVTLSVRQSEGMVRIRVQDNGCGIPEEKMKDVFKPFFTTKQHGTGLGLVIVKKMLARMQGTIEIASRKDEGTTVEISIPPGTPAPS